MAKACRAGVVAKCRVTGPPEAIRVSASDDSQRRGGCIVSGVVPHRSFLLGVKRDDCTCRRCRFGVKPRPGGPLQVIPASEKQRLRARVPRARHARSEKWSAADRLVRVAA